MAPTVSKPSAPAGSKDKRDEKKNDLVCRVRYNNTLPDIPFDPKFLAYQFDPQRFVEYRPTSLEKNYKYDLLTESDLGVHIDLINPDTYINGIGGPMHPADERLMDDEATTSNDNRRSLKHSRMVPWLRKTEYIAHDFTRYGSTTERNETKVGYQMKKKFKEEPVYRDRESQVRAINKTFEEVQKKVHKHYTKPGVVAVQELSVFPDTELWKYPCAQVIFDTDPAPANRSVSAQMEEMSQALIRGMMDSSGEQFVAYFLPTRETLLKRKRDAEAGLEYEPEEQYDYKLAREYNWTVKNKASKGYEENYFFVFRDDGVYYNELETRVRLNRRRAKEGSNRVSNSKLVVKHRELNEGETAAQDSRMTQLEAVAEEEVEEEHHSEAEAEAAGNGATGNATKREVDESATEENDHHSVESD